MSQVVASAATPAPLDACRGEGPNCTCFTVVCESGPASALRFFQGGGVRELASPGGRACLPVSQDHVRLAAAAGVAGEWGQAVRVSARGQTQFQTLPPPRSPPPLPVFAKRAISHRRFVERLEVKHLRCSGLLLGAELCVLLLAIYAFLRSVKRASAWRSGAQLGKAE